MQGVWSGTRDRAYLLLTMCRKTPESNPPTGSRPILEETTCLSGSRLIFFFRKSPFLTLKTAKKFSEFGEGVS
jgi:hypothetical protein